MTMELWASKPQQLVNKSYTIFHRYVLEISLGQVALAQDASELNIEELVTVGSRSNEPRSVTDSPVPVDVFSEAELSVFGN